MSVSIAAIPERATVTYNNQGSHSSLNTLKSLEFILAP